MRTLYAKDPPEPFQLFNSPLIKNNVARNQKIWSFLDFLLNSCTDTVCHSMKKIMVFFQKYVKTLYKESLASFEQQIFSHLSIGFLGRFYTVVAAGGDRAATMKMLRMRIQPTRVFAKSYRVATFQFSQRFESPKSFFWCQEKFYT